jgi:hypothetical protein
MPSHLSQRDAGGGAAGRRGIVRGELLRICGTVTGSRPQKIGRCRLTRRIHATAVEAREQVRLHRTPAPARFNQTPQRSDK